MKKLKFVLFVFFVSSLLIAQEAQTKGGAKNVNTITKAPAKVIDAPQGAIKTNNNITVVPYDFTASATAYYGGTNACKFMGLHPTTGDSIFAMIAGDTNGSGIITNSDKDAVINELNSSGYYNGDTNFSGLVTNSDKDFIINNLNRASQVPN